MKAAIWLHGSVVTGDVEIGDDSGIWFNAVMRGDVEPIRIGARSNVQDNAVLHTDPGFPCIIGDDVTIGHGAIVHGSRVGNGVTIGMGAVVLSGSEIGENAVVAAGALVTEGSKVAPSSSPGYPLASCDQCATKSEADLPPEPGAMSNEREPTLR